MSLQARAFFDMVQERLADPDFQGIMFWDGTTIPVATLRSISDPETLMAVVSRIASSAVEGLGNN